MDGYGLGDGPCERRVLKLVSMGNAIIAELLRLNDNLPVTLRLGKKDDKKFAPVLFDFSYFKNSELVEQKIKADKNLSRLDAELRDTHLELITRFYVVYEAIYKYVTDLNAVVRDLEDGVYFQHSLNSMFSTVDGRQLMCELVQLYGVALLTADRIGGSTRERLLVAYQRLGVRADSATCHVDDVCRLLRDTGIGTSAATGYPQLYFSRVAVDVRLVRLTLSHLRSADLYCQTADNYTLPEHRCVALASQAAMLFVCQFFSPNTLHKETTAMREIVDRFFSDNWVINVYMGWCVSLFEWWEPFKAARQALHGCLDLALVKQLTSKHADKLQELVAATGQQLREGVMTADVVLHDWGRLMSVVRECNVTLRWCLLARVHHTTDAVRRSRQLREAVLSEPRLDVTSLFQLLLNAAQLENNCRTQLKQLLASREAVWMQKQAELVAGLSEVADVFSGAISLTRLAKNVGLERWFRERSVDMAAVTLLQASADSCRLLQMVRALSQVQTLHRMESDLAVVQRLEQLRTLLRDLTLTAGLRDRQLACLDVLADFSYGWQLVDSLMPHMQLLIAQRPKVLAKFHAVFIKVSSALDTPLMRINQAGSGDLESVSQFYSAEMVRYVRQLLQVVPRTMFRLLERIVDILTNELKELPPRIEESKIGEYVQPEVRSKISSLVYELCVLTEGMLSMKTTLVGIVHLDPAELLRDGCGSQLAILLSDVLHSTLTFSQKHKGMDVLSRLEALDRRLQGLQLGLEYTQDYLRISGLKLWRQQLDQLLTGLVQQEVERVGRLSWKQQDCTREYSCGGVSTGIKPGVAEPNCVGRLVEQLLMATHPRQTVYVFQQLSWCSRSPQQQPAAVADRQLVQLVLSCLGVAGLLGVDRLLGLRARAILKTTLSLITVDIGRDANCSDTLDSLHATFQLPGTDTGLPRACSSAFSLLQRHLYRLLEQMALLGQLSLLREVIALQIRIGARLHSPHLSAMLNTLSRSVMSETDAADDTLTPLLRQLTPYLSHAGLTQPKDTVYLSQVQVRDPAVQRYTPTLLTLLIYAQTSKFTYCGKFGDLLPTKDGVDPSALMAGISCLLAQLPASSGGRVAALVSRLVCACVSAPGSPPSAEIAVLLRLLERLRYERHLSDAGACGVPAIVISTFRCQ